MEEVYNFNAGPAVLPKAVMLKAQEEFVNYHGIGYGIIEESHRNANFEEVITSCEANIRKLMGISDDYEVLFLQELLNTARNFPTAFFEDDQGRMKVLDAVQEAVDQAIAREDEYLAGQEG